MRLRIRKLPVIARSIRPRRHDELGERSHTVRVSQAAFGRGYRLEAQG